MDYSSNCHSSASSRMGGFLNETHRKSQIFTLFMVWLLFIGLVFLPFDGYSHRRVDVFAPDKGLAAETPSEDNFYVAHLVLKKKGLLAEADANGKKGKRGGKGKP